MVNDFISWEIKDSIIESGIIKGTKKLGSTNPVFIVDQFSRKAPMLVNENLLTNKEVNYSIKEEALLDSNVVDLIDRFVNKQASTEGLNAFLKFVIENGWNLNPLFYLLEHFSKSPIDNFKKNATRRLESIIKIFCMDEDHYLSTNSFRITDKATQEYLLQCGEPSIQAAAVSWVDEFIDSYKNNWFSSLVEATEVMLIKMLLIRKVEMINACPSDQMKALESFCRVNMKVIMGRELHFSLHYFCDKAGKLFGIQANTTFAKAVSILSSTAWDINLLRLPERLLLVGGNNLIVSYVTTQEVKLSELASLYSVQKISKYSDSNTLPELAFDLSLIPKKIVDKLNLRPRPTNLDEKKTLPIGLHQTMLNELERFCT